MTLVWDTAAPDTSITSQPSSLTNVTSAALTFTSTETGSTFQCQLDGGGYSVCTSPKSYIGLIEGSHTFYVKATDSAGNTDSTPASYTWTIDTPAPAITINAVTTPSNSTSQTVTGTIEAGATVNVATDTAASDGAATVTGTTWSHTITGLVAGANNITVTAADVAGNTATATSSITLDTTVPDTSITSKPANPTNITSASFGFTSSEADSGFECQMDGGGWSACTSPGSYTVLTERDHTFHVRATDAAGNTDGTPVSYTWTIDITVPALTLSTLADGAVTNNSILNIAGMVTDYTGIQSLVINGDEITVNTDGSFSHALQLTVGLNTVTTIATDLAGNKATDTRVITLDLTAPTLAITSPADNSKTADSVIDVTGTVDENATIEIRLNDRAAQAASVIGNTFTATLTLEAGINTIEISAIDLAGNKATQKRTVTYDNTRPSLEVTSPNQDIKTNQSSMVIKGIVSDTLTAVTITIKVENYTFTPQLTDGQFEQTITFNLEKTYQVTITAADEAGNISTVQRNIIYDITGPFFDVVVTSSTNDSSQTIAGNREENVTIMVTSSSATARAVTYPTATTWSIIISNMVEGTNTVTVTARDAAGNETSIIKEVVLDTTAPDTSITARPPSQTNSTSATFSYTSTETGSVFQCQLDNGGYISCTSSKSYTGITDGSHTFFVTATDIAGNTDTFPASYTWTIDTAPPTTTASPQGGSFTSIQSVALSCSDGTGSGCDKIHYTTDGSTPTTSSAVYASPINISATTTLKFFSTDKAGNSETMKKEVYTINTVATSPDITATPTTLPFGNVNIDSSSERSVSVRNDGDANLVIGTITDPSSPFSKVSDNCSDQTLSPSAGCTITIKFSPKSTNTFTSSVNIPSNDQDENPVTISLTGAGTNAESPDIAVLPSLDLSFLNIPVGVTADQTITLKNEGTSDLIISGITLNSTPFSIVSDTENCSNHSLTPGQSCTIKIRFAPTTTGTFNSSFDIQSNDPDENPVTLNLSGSANDNNPNPPTKPNLVEPVNGATGMPTTLTLKWEISTDVDGDPVTYRLYIGTDPGFADASPKILASASGDNNSAMAMRYSVGIIGLLGIIAVGRLSSNRKKMGLFFIVIIMVTGFIFTSCGSSGGGEGNNNGSDNKSYESYKINLQPDTTYYWKVVADDGKGGVTESDTYSFTTGR